MVKELREQEDGGQKLRGRSFLKRPEKREESRQPGYQRKDADTHSLDLGFYNLGKVAEVGGIKILSQN